jgi:phage terminase large subunit
MGSSRYKGAFGGRGCVHPDTLIDVPGGQIPIKDFTGGFVWSWKDGQKVIAVAAAATPFTVEQLYEVGFDDGRSIIVTDQHKFLTNNGWKELQHLCAVSDDIVALPIGAADVNDFTLASVAYVHEHSRQVYWDLHVFGTNNYLSNGIVNHNSGKSHLFAEMLIEKHIINPSHRSVCVREYQKSLSQSVKRLLEIKIEQLGVGSYFEVQEAVIKSKRGDGLIIFQGMQNHTADSIKSLEGYDLAWVEEAQSLSQRSLDLLRPTIRKPNSELWFTWNPSQATDPVDLLLRGESTPPNAVVIEVNFKDNPWFPDVLQAEMEYDRGRDIDKYNHVWLGGYARNSEARVFRNWKVEDFETPPDAVHRFGADWGFSVDPTVLVRCHIVGRKLYIDHEAYQVGCEIMDTPSLFFTIPESEKWPIIADSARPETISHMRKNGFPKIMPAVKGKDSLHEGIEFIKTYDIVVHPRCAHTIDELTMYSYKTDPLTGAVTSVLGDKKNHVIDALRYACEASRRIAKQTVVEFIEPGYYTQTSHRRF